MLNAGYSISYKEDKNWHMHKLHFHDSMELLLPLTDGGDFFLDKSIYPISRNMLFIMKPNTLHRDTHDINESVFRRYIMHISRDYLESLSTIETDFLSVLEKSSGPIMLDDEKASRIATYMESLSIPRSKGFGNDVTNLISLYQLFLDVCDGIRSNSHIEQENSQSYEKITPILNYIRTAYRDQLKLDDLSRLFMMNKHYMCHIFKEGTGFSVMEYVIQLRIIEGQRLLRKGFSVQDAGEKSGFQSYEHFIRTFSKYTGISPKQYSKMYLNGEHVPGLLERSTNQL